ncbi:hypothetical protein J5I95_13635 [Candidatus Poribacteria bacterium]|nr:hypothetical protein [Candidatus Poribacteria bacterium]
MKYVKFFAPALILFSLTLLKGGWVYAETSATEKDAPPVENVQETQTTIVINGKEIPVDLSKALNVDVNQKQGTVVVNGKSFTIDTSKGVNLRLSADTSKGVNLRLSAKPHPASKRAVPPSTADTLPLTKAQQQLRAFFGPIWKRPVVGKSEKGQQAIQVPVVKEKSKQKEKPKKGKFKHKEKYKEKNKAP